jgi:hypothetical protein
MAKLVEFTAADRYCAIPRLYPALRGIADVPELLLAEAKYQNYLSVLGRRLYNS